MVVREIYQTWAKPNDVIVPGLGIGFDNNGSSANAAIRTCAMYGKDARGGAITPELGTHERP